MVNVRYRTEKGGITAENGPMNSPTRHPIDPSLSAWIEAYGQLKTAQTIVKAAGPKSTLLMRQDVDRLQVAAEKTLKHLQTHFDAARRLSSDPSRQRSDLPELAS